MRAIILTQVLVMAWDSLRSHKMRSALTVLGIVIGITMVVGMTSLIRGFDRSITGQIQSLGSDTLFLVKWGGRLASLDQIRELNKRPDITAADVDAIEEQAETVFRISVMYGQGFPPSIATIRYRGNRSDQTVVFGVSSRFLDAGDMELGVGRFISPLDVRQRSDVVVIGNGARQALFDEGVDPINRRIRVKGREYRVVGVIKKRAVASLAGDQADNFVIVPASNYRKLFGPRPPGTMLVMRAKPEFTVEQMQNEVEGIMRARHGLRADQEPDFDLMTQQMLLDLWKDMSMYFFVTLVALSSVALMVGGIGVMAIMLVSVTERTREIGVRKALGARRDDVLTQFLAEAVALAAAGGLLGALIGAGVGYGAHMATGFPISLPWWSFAIAVGTSSLIGVISGIYPANRAAQLDPVEALRYE